MKLLALVYLQENQKVVLLDKEFTSEKKAEAYTKLVFGNTAIFYGTVPAPDTKFKYQMRKEYNKLIGK